VTLTQQGSGEQVFVTVAAGSRHDKHLFGVALDAEQPFVVGWWGTGVRVTPPEEDVPMVAVLSDPTPRPVLRVLPGRRSAGPLPAVLRRRRLVALTLAVAFVVVATLWVGAALRPPARVVGGGSLTPSGGPPPAASGAATVLVQPGDTLWTIARDLRPRGDLRPVVDELVALNGGAALQAGQVLVLPG
jgi:hypothetical protein